MYVCVCNAVTDRRIRELAASGVDSMEELRRLSGCGDCCGQCVDQAEELLEAAAGGRESSGPSRRANQPDPSIPVAWRSPSWATG